MSSFTLSPLLTRSNMGNFFSRRVRHIQLSIAPDAADLRGTFQHEHHYAPTHPARSSKSDREGTTHSHRPQNEHFYFETNMDMDALFRCPTTNGAYSRSAAHGQQDIDFERRGSAHTCQCSGHDRPRYHDVGASDDERELEQIMTEIMEQWRTGRADRETTRVREAGERAVRRAIGTS